MGTAESQPEIDPELDPEEGPSLILVVDDDQDIAGFVEFNLKLRGFEVIRAKDGQGALDLMETHRPDLAIVDWMMPGMDGVELIRQLRAEPLTSALPVIMLTAMGLTGDKVHGLQAGADDYLVKPFDLEELIARVSNTLRRHKDAREVSPLTGLPGNARVRREIGERMRGGGDFSVGYIDVDRFKSVNDVYGFDRGDEFIIALARSLQRAASQSGKPSIFLGHIGGDDFVFICHPEQVLPLTQRTVTDFESAADRLYEPGDARRGYIEVPDRRGNKQKAALVTLSIGVAQATADGRRFTDPRMVIAVASEMKKVAKSQPGSYVAIDRRRSESE